MRARNLALRGGRFGFCRGSFKGAATVFLEAFSGVALGQQQTDSALLSPGLGPTPEIGPRHSPSRL
jgi:hypothetical protein